MNKTDYLITGSSGFFGNIIFTTLIRSYSVSTLGRSMSNDLKVDLANTIPEFCESFVTVIHVSGKAHMTPKTNQEVEDFFKVNYQGTINLAKGLEQSGVPKCFVFISTVAVYGQESGEGLDEDYLLLGKSPYARSKILAEEFLTQWCAQNNVKLTILRLPLIVAVNPPGNLGAMVRMMKRGLYFGVGSGNARKSIVLAEDVARFIPVIQHIGGIYNLTDGYNPSMAELEHSVSESLKRKKPVRLPIGLLRFFARLGDVIHIIPVNTVKLKKLTTTLTFSDIRARAVGWNPRTVVHNLPFR